LVEVGPATIAAGGAVANTGIALHRLEVPVRLRALVGDDLFGEGVRRLLAAEGDGLADGLMIAPGLPTSYTLVFSPSGEDRTFLHCPGGNDGFGPEHLDDAVLEGAAHVHFGSPPLMARMHADQGEALAATLGRARGHGATTSLDLSLPDIGTAQGLALWRRILERALPSVDLFVPSREELAFMLGEAGDPTGGVDSAMVLAERAMDFGAGAAVVKCGADGLLVRTGDPGRMASAFLWHLATAEEWRDRTLWSSCFAVSVVGTTGSGDTTIAGLLRGLWRGEGPLAAATGACAAGAACCEAPDATSGVPNGPELDARIAVGWPRRRPPLTDDWRESDVPGVWIHEGDRVR